MEDLHNRDGAELRRKAQDAFMPQLDGLRAFAVVIVVAQHTMPGPLTWMGLRGFGVYGVWLFFVLSGFLITGILLRSRDAAGATIGHSLGAFYARRFLRIFPLYYAVVIIGALFHVGAFRGMFYWNLTYLSNWRMAYLGRWPLVCGVLWSLAVEEQFYLIWPAIVLCAPRRWWPRLAITGIVLGAASRLALAMIFPVAPASPRVLVPTTSNLDALGLGALLAWHRHAHPAQSAARERWARLALFSGLALIAGVAIVSISGHRMDVALAVSEALGMSLVAVWLINGAADGFAGRSPLGAALSAAPVRYVGTISYGVYLLHEPVLWVLAKSPSVDALQRNTTPRQVLLFLVVASATIAVASVSWFAYERPLNRLKRFFPYEPAGRTDGEPAAVVAGASGPSTVTPVPVEQSRAGR